MGLFSNKIGRDKLKAGDHIYSWRTAHIYSHHGIYIGNGEVVHFTRGGGLETGTRTFLDKIIVSSVPNHGACLNGGDQSKLDGVITSCLDCFLARGKLYRYEYGVSPAFFKAKPIGVTCTTATSDSPENVISRAKFLLSTKGFGAYDLVNNNCEDFAIYCKTSLIVLSNPGSSGQVSAAGTALFCSASGLAESVWLGNTATSILWSTAASAVTCIVSLALVGSGYHQYCRCRLKVDIGMREDAVGPIYTKPI